MRVRVEVKVRVRVRVSVGVKTWEKAPRPSLAETCVHCICVVWHVVRQSVHVCGVVWCVMCGMAIQVYVVNSMK